ncbi:E3 ubiquitin-protein ligase RNF14-like [Megachile rotundata]|uniref:E3 ubiquitin-protein ligase RNF14-like n=1 Tax=Megachile rotundata TaxID=143995 RepID=UPI003FD082C5
MNNRDRQENEILVLSSIYNHNEFSYIQGDIIEIYFNVFPTNNDKVIKLKNAYNKFSKCLIKYLPPIRIYVQLPKDYPTKCLPNFYIMSSWLTPWQTSSVCQHLDEIWLKNKEQEILFLWFEFLRNDLLNFLQINDTLDISFLYLMKYSLTDYFKLNAILEKDARAICNALIFNPIKFFMDYNDYQLKLTFENSSYMCIICFEIYYGKYCTKLQNCSHIFCRNCIQQYITTKINENVIKNIICPDLSCNCAITYNEIKMFCPNLFSKYEDLLLHVTLNSMQDIVFCPRISCQCPVVKDDENTLIVCSKCDYSFCSLCHKVYHGSAPCAIMPSEFIKIIEDYEKGNTCQKQLLQKKYGKKQIQEIEKHLTKNYLKENTKTCPQCQTTTAKVDGCNKMTCTYCNAQFCWLCGTQITTENPYDHFLLITNMCYTRLFD